MRHLLCLLPCLLAACAVRPPACPPEGRWISPATLHAVPDPIASAATQPAVLLGEAHDNAADHRWELTTIEQLYAAHPNMALGFEMFPRSAQHILNVWVQGQLNEGAFIQQSGWKEYWGFDPELYLPIFRFARDHRIPMLALNVSHRLVHVVGHNGWVATPAALREGVGTPAPPSAAYRATLKDAMSGHGGPAMTPAALDHFVDAQLVWDRAMAEGVADAHARDPARLVVAIMGAGHLEQREGVPHQLTALGIPNAAVLLPSHGDCLTSTPGQADAIYTD